MTTNNNNKTRLTQSRSELSRNLIASSLTTAFCVSVLNPLDVLRIRWQTRPPGVVIITNKSADNIIAFTKSTLRTNTLTQLWTCGIGVNAMSVALSSGFRQGLYPTVRDTLIWLRGPTSSKSIFDMWFGGFISGAIGFFLATPFFAAKIRSQQYDATKTGWQELQYLFQTKTAFHGTSILIIRGALLSAGASLGYDFTKTKGRQYWTLHNNEGPWLHALGSISASFLATTLSCPFDVLMTRYATATTTTNQLTIIATVREIYSRHGIKGFWSGWTLFFIRVTPLWIIQLPLYEQVRKLLGMDFMD
jgi:hypothetical protein